MHPCFSTTKLANRGVLQYARKIFQIWVVSDRSEEQLKSPGMFIDLISSRMRESNLKASASQSYHGVVFHRTVTIFPICSFYLRGHSHPLNSTQTKRQQTEILVSCVVCSQKELLRKACWQDLHMPQSMHTFNSTASQSTLQLSNLDMIAWATAIRAASARHTLEKAVSIIVLTVSSSNHYMPKLLKLWNLVMNGGHACRHQGWYFLLHPLYCLF